VQLQEDTSYITRFQSPLTGLSYKNLVIPMGLLMSPYAFVRVMQKVFNDKIKYSFLKSYTDDVICLSDSWNQHLTHLQLLFQTLRENNLSLNPSKANIGFSEVDFLGCTVSADGIKISEKKVAAIRAIQTPKSRKSLQRLLGLLNFFRRYVGNFSQKTQHMRSLLPKDTTFIWTQECSDELESLKSC